jgi:hypothetical protein
MHLTILLQTQFTPAAAARFTPAAAARPAPSAITCGRATLPGGGT